MSTKHTTMISEHEEPTPRKSRLVTPADHIVVKPKKGRKVHARGLARKTTFCGRPSDLCVGIYPWEKQPEVTCKICSAATLRV